MKRVLGLLGLLAMSNIALLQASELTKIERKELAQGLRQASPEIRGIIDDYMYGKEAYRLAEVKLGERGLDRHVSRVKRIARYSEGFFRTFTAWSVLRGAYDAHNFQMKEISRNHRSRYSTHYDVSRIQAAQDDYNKAGDALSKSFRSMVMCAAITVGLHSIQYTDKLYGHASPVSLRMTSQYLESTSQQHGRTKRRHWNLHSGKSTQNDNAVDYPQLAVQRAGLRGGST